MKKGTDIVKPVPKPETIAKSLAIGTPADGYYAIHVMRQTGGFAEDVSDDEVVEGIKLLAEHAGIFAETAGGVTVGVARKLIASGKIPAKDSVVLCITGNGLKTIDAVVGCAGQTREIKPSLREFEAMLANEEPLPEELRQPAIAEIQARDRQPSSLQGLRVLVVDDEIDARTLLTMMLEKCGAQVVAVGSSREGLESVEAWRPDVLIADIGMPVEDGYGLIRRVRKLPKKKGGQTPALALTAYARTEDRVRALSEGYQVHLAKPVDRFELAADFLGAGRHARSVPQRRAGTALETLQIRG